MKVVGIILAAGESHRFGAASPKQFCQLGGRPVVAHSIATFRASGLFAEILVVLPPAWVAESHIALGDRNIAGGATRNASTWAALQACPPDTDIVLIHDAARPLVTIDILTRCIEALKLHPAVDVCLPAEDTIVATTPDGFIDQIPDRRRMMRGQTPQGFHFAAIREAYAANLHQLDATDDVGIFLRRGGHCKVVLGSPTNFKITYPEDLLAAEALLARATGSASATGRVAAATVSSRDSRASPSPPSAVAPQREPCALDTIV